MRAIAYNISGGPEVLEVAELPDVSPGHNEVLIRVRAVAVSPTDSLRRASLPTGEGPGPFVVGMDAAGVIEAVGDGATTDLKVGDEVMAFVIPNGSHGAYAEKIVVSADSAARIPAGSSLAEASTLPMNGLTARLALDTLALPKGSTIAVTGAAGALGGYVIQLAKSDGLVVVADASAADRELIKSLGADYVFSRGKEFAGEIRARFAEGVDGVVDAALMLDDIVPAAKDNATVITTRGANGERDRGVILHPILVMDYDREQAKLDLLRQQVEDGVLTLRVADQLPMEQASEAHRRMDAGGVRGRLVLEF